MTSKSIALARGTLLSVILRWFSKALGMISLIILARFLGPEDYGILVMAGLVIGIVEIFFFTSADTALLRDADFSNTLANSAWTLRLAQAFVVALFVIAVSPLAGKYFNEPRVIPVMIALGTGLIIAALANIGPVISRRNLEFGIEVKLGMVSKIIGFITTIFAAYQLRNYWALVIGTYASHITNLVLSYTWHPYRPKLEIKLIGRLWKFSQWLLVSGIGSFLGRKSDELILGSLGTTQALGIYNVGSELGQTPTVEISAPVNRSLYPVLSSMQGHEKESVSLFFSTLATVNTLTIPIGIGMAVLAEPITHVALGSKWLGVIPILEIFAIQGVIRFLVSPYYVWFMVIGKSRTLAAVAWVEVLGFLVLAFFLYEGSPEMLAWARLISTFFTGMLWIGLGTTEGLKLLTLLSSIYRPLIAGGIMALSLMLSRSFFVSGNYITDLLFLIFLGILIFSAAIILVWLLFGRPNGVETLIIDNLSKIIKDFLSP